jgi:hypothetical protein
MQTIVKSDKGYIKLSKPTLPIYLPAELLGELL